MDDDLSNSDFLRNFYLREYTTTGQRLNMIMERERELIILLNNYSRMKTILTERQNSAILQIDRLSNNGINHQERQPETTQNETPTNFTEENNRNETSNRIVERLFRNILTPSNQPRNRTIPRNTSSSSANDYEYIIYSVLPERTRLSIPSPSTTPTPLGQNETSIVDDFINSFLNPIQISPTQEQITNATTTIKYRDIEMPINTSCPISLTTFQANDEIIQINRCGHNYTPQSLMEWFREHTICPLCRIDIREE